MKRTLSWILMIAAWFAIIVQYYLMLENRTTSFGEATLRFFSFFTILTNILVAVYFTVKVFRQDETSFFHRKGVLTAITVYISVVGLVYQILLRDLWEPEGLQRVVDELLHSVIPLGVLLYWYVSERKRIINWGSMFRWLLFPFFYLIYILMRGAISGFYPYPFINVSQLGLEKALINASFLFLVFLLIAVIYVSLGRMYVLRKSVKSKV